MPVSSGRRRRRRRTAVLGALLALVLPAGALAYDGVGAASYADTHWAECGWVGTAPSPYVCMARDCANYASRAMHSGGGYRFIDRAGIPGVNDYWFWYSAAVGDKTITWYQAQSLYSFLVAWDHGDLSHGGGNLVTSFVGVTHAQKYNPLSKGDMIFFDWTNDGSIDHVRIETGYGVPSRTGWQSAYNAYWYEGDWADQHDPNRYHDFWNGSYVLTPAEAAVTKVYEVHIPSTSG